MIEKKNIVIVGAGGHAKVVIDVLEREGKYRIVGILDPHRNVGDSISGYSVVGSEVNIVSLRDSMSIYGVVIAVGDNFMRASIAANLVKFDPDLVFISSIHPSAILGSRVQIGEGSIVMAGACINSDAVIGRLCIVNTRASIDHDAIFGDYSSMGPGAVCGGQCKVGEYTAIGIGSVLKHSVNIGEHTVLGAGSLVLRSIESNVVAYGSPAETARKRAVGERYLT